MTEDISISANESPEESADENPAAAETPEKNQSEQALANIEKYGVKNPKGRIASVLSLILWSMFLAMLFLKGDWSIGPVLLALLFVLLLLLTGVRLIQEWKENGDWLE